MDTTIDVSSPDGARPGVMFEWRHVAQIESTNDPLLAEPFGESPRSPVVLRADRQTGGRGRRGRRWVSDPARALTFSIALERGLPTPARVLTGFSLVVGVALCEALHAQVADIGLKWPNDLLRAGGKAGGILIEARRHERIERVVIGIGLNLLAPEPGPADAEAGSRPAGALHPTGLFDAPGFDVDALMRRCAVAVANAFEQFVEAGFGAFAERWRRFDALAGQRVSLHDGERVIARGVVAGVDAQGELRLSLEGGGERSFAIGEISLRPVAGDRRGRT